MNRSTRTLVVALFLIPTAGYGQSVARVNLNKAETYLSEPTTEVSNDRSERFVAATAIRALKRLDNDVLVYRSLGDFEDEGKLARVPFEAFKNDLREVTAEVESQLSRLPQSRLKGELSNALDSYRDGAFWWEKIYQPRVVHVSALNYNQTNRPPSETAFLATVPYTVAIHWRQAAKYLKRAEKLMNEAQNAKR